MRIDDKPSKASKTLFPVLGPTRCYGPCNGHYQFERMWTIYGGPYFNGMGVYRHVCVQCAEDGVVAKKILDDEQERFLKSKPPSRPAALPVRGDN